MAGDKVMLLLTQHFTSLEGLHFFLTLNRDSVMLVSGTGSSVMNKTRSLLTLAKSKMSLNNSVQYGFTDRPSTRDKSPPGNKYNKAP